MRSHSNYLYIVNVLWPRNDRSFLEHRFQVFEKLMHMTVALLCGLNCRKGSFDTVKAMLSHLSVKLKARGGAGGTICPKTLVFQGPHRIRFLILDHRKYSEMHLKLI